VTASFVYHWVPAAMVGSTLYPLNDLEQREPDVWRRERAKYDGRKHVLEVPVPPLDCLWNDVLHFSPVHPAEIVAALVAAGLQPLRRRTFVVDTAALDPERTVIFLNRGDSGGERIDADQWRTFDPALLLELSDLTEPTRRYYRECAAQGTRPLLYGYLPHVLFRGPLETRDLQVLEL
jgi:hypothetical protein